MRIDLVCFTTRGQELGEKLRDRLCARNDQAHLDRCGSAGRPITEWVKDRFAKAGAIIFIGAAGIAVRAISPHVRSKTSDPAVVVVDDTGRFAISLLSGHIGGANELAIDIAEFIGAIPVITTATDCSDTFAVDTFARRQGLVIRNPEAIKTVSAKLLSGEMVNVSCTFPVVSPLPDGLQLNAAAADLLVDIRHGLYPGALHLVPPILTLGIGCRKGTSCEAIDDAVVAWCEAEGVAIEAIGKVASIDLKKDEPGLVAFCARRKLRLETHSAEMLAALSGTFTASEFVELVAGVDNVCERSAVADGRGQLLLRKTIVNGIALAMAIRDYAVDLGDGAGKNA